MAHSTTIPKEIFVVETSKSLEQVCKEFPEIVTKHKFGVLHTHNVQETLAKKGIQLERKCFIFEICNPFEAKKLFDENMAVAAHLPCRVAIYDDVDNKVKLTMQRIDFGLGVFGEIKKEQIEKLSKDVYDILQDAASASTQ